MKAGAALAAFVVALGIGSISASADQTTPSDGWVREDISEGVVWYYYKDGEKQTGWLKDGIDWYYLNEDGSMKADEWFTDTDGNIYYFRTWGGMQYNAWGSLTENVTISAAGVRRGITAGIRLADSGITSARMERQ